MNKNIGTLDKVFRIVVGAILISLVFVGPQTAWGWIGVVLVATALIDFCPLYRVVGFSSRKKTV
ncbi:MAG: DUF2892 domain-containing protein [Gammaproteobacteria bacterium]|nr:DUF2892 domain-containing protein [Gammaproteobacteria bacterium]MDH5801080.1 DUF2892 domain-containing protein [Gammaproteobacteria bacterium]